MNNPKTITIAGKSSHPLTVNRLGYGTMRLTGEGIYGEPPRRAEALEILRQTAVQGIHFLDTADYYGEDVTNRLIAEALYPYNDDLVICTKVGGARKPDKSWIPFNKPENLRSSIENNLRTLKLEQITLVHFRLIGGNGFEAAMEAMFNMQQEGKILHVGVSNVNAAQLEKAMQMGKIATVENMYGHAQRSEMKAPYGITHGAEEILHICEANEIPLLPFFSLLTANSKKDKRITAIAQQYGVTEAQINIAWLLHRSPWILPIPGTSSLQHFEENVQAANIELTEEDMAFLE
ncbi:MAG TPA: aldo/keto reductase [Panacibacter sp.]|nr:aldo/keto reductase [Panacibacter sp.]